MTVSPVMQRLAAYIAQAPRRRLPAAVAEKTKHHLLDTIAAMVSGSRLLPGRKAIAYARTRGGTKEAGVVATNISSTDRPRLGVTRHTPAMNTHDIMSRRDMD